MQIFCDESGGSDASNLVFLTAAVAVASGDATRLLKTFRKATRIPGEIKGTHLSIDERALFFSLVLKSEAASVVVSCSRADGIGGWAMGALNEADLYRRLLTESCIALPNLNDATSLTITPDQGRYKATQLAIVGGHIKAALATLHPAIRVSVNYGNSAALPGLQIADIVANSVFRSLTDHADAEQIRAMLRPLTARGILDIRSIGLADVRPSWLDGV